MYSLSDICEYSEGGSSEWKRGRLMSVVGTQPELFSSNLLNCAFKQKILKNPVDKIKIARKPLLSIL